MGEKYEAVFIIKENKDEENIKNIIKNIIESEKFKIFKEETIGNKKLAYEIKGEKRGIFYLLNLVFMHFLSSLLNIKASIEDEQ